ncbi:hypothetical protein QAD02_020477 [Eretmocerus hayati]|uniref:Uncharacterized protein n=1 Tax=Eretmocerus hayati TaxID=131215 RepID=A0ACC2PM75_9HYME|nr:hypothetical protein QAD02_020477 [Eretmocerus hayati]
MADLEIFNSYSPKQKYVSKKISDLKMGTKYTLDEVKNIKTKDYGYAVVLKMRDPHSNNQKFDLFAPKDLKDRIQSNLSKNSKKFNDPKRPLYVTKTVDEGEEKLRFYPARVETDSEEEDEDEEEEISSPPPSPKPSTSRGRREDDEDDQPPPYESITPKRKRKATNAPSRATKRGRRV